MATSFMSLLPHLCTTLETMKFPIQASASYTEMMSRFLSLEMDFLENSKTTAMRMTRHFAPLMYPGDGKACERFIDLIDESTSQTMDIMRENFLAPLGSFHQKRRGEIEFLNLFIGDCPCQDWTVEYDNSKVILDLPSMRVIDISLDAGHDIDNYTVVFAPRAGHHSNIAERVAVYMRDHGLPRMALVEQKCAEDIPLYIDGTRHDESFKGQVEQYRQVLECVRDKTGVPAHMVAICQPGPLLISTLILYPHLGKTFGSAGSPMHTEAERGVLTDFAHLMGEPFIDYLVSLFAHTIPEGYPGAGRKTFDGRVQILGFYLLGMDQHMQNFKQLLDDLRDGKRDSAERQLAFYQWYNYVHHFPVSFIRDTYRKIFVNNELIHGTLAIGERVIGIKDYPSVPIWALGGLRDNIAPPLQATAHLDLIDSVPSEGKLSLLCDGGHMALFRSREVLATHYSRIVRFMREHSDRSEE